MAKNISVTVITACFNSANVIEATLNSVLNQNYRPLEYIVIDGNSNDGTQNLIEKYIHRYNEAGIVIKFTSEIDNGIADAFNKGIDLASGDLIGFLNADDIFYDENALVNIANSYVDDNTCICGSILLEDSQSEAKKFTSKPEKLKQGMYIQHPASYVPRSLFVKVGKFNLALRIAMDFDFFTRLMISGCNFVTDNNNIITIMRTGGASSDSKKASIEELKVKNVYYGKKLSHYFHFYISRSINLIKRLARS